MTSRSAHSRLAASVLERGELKSFKKSEFVSAATLVLGFDVTAEYTASTTSKVQQFAQGITDCGSAEKKIQKYIYKQMKNRITRQKKWTILAMLEKRLSDNDRADVFVGDKFMVRERIGKSRCFRERTYVLPKLIFKCTRRKLALRPFGENPYQIFRYMKHILLKNVAVKDFFGVITNGRSFQLCLISWDSFSSFQMIYCQDDFSYDNPADVRILLNLVSAEVQVRNMELRLPSGEYSLIELAGLGGSSIVYIAAMSFDVLGNESPSKYLTGKLFVVKIFKSLEIYNNEKRFYESQQAAKLPMIDGVQFHELAGVGYCTMPLADPVVSPKFGSKHQKVHHPTPTEFKVLLESVREMHKRNIIHGDIRAQNLAFYKERLVLLDFGFARLANCSEAAYCGTKETAASRLMRKLAQNRNAYLSVTERDELESLYKCYLTITDFHVVDRPRKWKELFKFWSDKELVRRFYKNESYEEFYSAFNNILESKANVEAEAKDLPSNTEYSVI